MSARVTAEAAVARMQSVGLLPLEPYPGNRREKWHCRCQVCGDKVFTTLSSVTSNGGGCKRCGIRKSKQKRLTSENLAISTMFEAGLRPLTPYDGRNKPWKCECISCGRVVTPRLGNVVNGHKGCAYCARRKVDAQDAVKLMREKGIDPQVPFPGANEPWLSTCLRCGSQISPTYSSIQVGQGGCLTCGYVSSSLKQRGDESEALEILKEKKLVPLENFPGSHKPWHCKCLKCNSEIWPHLSSLKTGTGCAVCAGRRVNPENARQIMLASNLEPLTEYPGSKVGWKSRCLICSKIVYPNYGDIKQGDGGCKYCAKRFVDPKVAMQICLSKDLTPLEPYPGNQVPWNCRCNRCKRTVAPQFAVIRKSVFGCGYCARVKVDPDEAWQTMVDAGVEPLEPYPGARNGWRCRCNKCKREVYPFFSSVLHQGTNPCLYCAGKKVDPKSAFELMVAADLTPLEQYERADKPWLCLCNQCDRQVSPTYTAIRIGQGGCKYCVDRGLDYLAPAFLYLLVHKQLGAYKLGIGNHKSRPNRIKDHKRYGWELLSIVDFATGDEAYLIEQRVLAYIRTVLGIGPFLAKSQLQQGGWTETIDLERISGEAIWDCVQLEIKSVFGRPGS